MCNFFTNKFGPIAFSLGSYTKMKIKDNFFNRPKILTIEKTFSSPSHLIAMGNNFIFLFKLSFFLCSEPSVFCKMLSWLTTKFYFILPQLYWNTMPKHRQFSSDQLDLIWMTTRKVINKFVQHFWQLLNCLAKND